MPPYPRPSENPKCFCIHINPLAPTFCAEGHLTECHAGMSCSEAECSHYEASLEADSETEAETLDRIWPEDFPEED